MTMLPALAQMDEPSDDGRIIRLSRLRSGAGFKIDTKPANDSACQKPDAKSSDFQFERPDWSLFRSIDTLSQKAGVPRHLLRRLVLKELVDNALDAGATVSVKTIGEGRYLIEDDGPGIAGSAEEIARLFSINRPLVSSKLWLMPTRGALGNGLRVVTGAVIASSGSLTVWTRNRRLDLTPQDDGSTNVSVSPATIPVGTRIDITLGSDLPVDRNATMWAARAIALASGGDGYGGKTSPFWYSGERFFELLRAAGERPVREVIARLDGCTGARAGQITGAFKGLPSKGLSREQAITLLTAARSLARPVRPERLGAIGPVAALPKSYALRRGVVTLDGREPKAEIPFVVEVWSRMMGAAASDEAVEIALSVNRTPITGDISAHKRKAAVSVFGCGLSHSFSVGRGSFEIHINLSTPLCPITTDGKEPDLRPFVDLIAEATIASAKRAKLTSPKSVGSDRRTQKDIILDHIKEAVAKASGNGAYRFSLRQLFYVIRPFVIEEHDKEPSWDNFGAIITAYEDENGSIDGMYRDPRGTLYHPHTGESIPIGTLAVENYERPNWTFNKLLYIEKEGFFEALKAVRWPERNDCALLSSKGYSTRAVRDLLDLFADDGEPVQVFCIHDADADGTMIYQTLQEETKARPRRRIEIINLGLEAWEAVEMGLTVEPRSSDAARSSRAATVADYVAEHVEAEEWRDWLQEKRVELNAMTTPQFIEWLDRKMAEHDDGKVVPPKEVVVDALKSSVERDIRKRITTKILADARIDDLVGAAESRVVLPTEDAINAVGAWLEDNKDRPWTGWVDSAASELAAAVVNPPTT